MAPQRCNSADEDTKASSNSLCGRYAKGLIRLDEALRLEVCCGGVLLSHNLAVAVPLALPGLASRFGMEAGRFPGAMTTTRLVFNTVPHALVGVWVDRGLYSGCGTKSLFAVFCSHPNVLFGWLFSVGPLVPVGSRAHCCASTSGLSTR